MTDCLFCKIIAKEIPADIVYEDEIMLAFKDIKPVAPYHILVIPKQHIATLNDLTAQDSSLIAAMMLKIPHIANEIGVAQSGYRTVINCNSQGGQEVYHLHIHLIAGKQLNWPPC